MNQASEMPSYMTSDPALAVSAPDVDHEMRKFQAALDEKRMSNIPDTSDRHEVTPEPTLPQNSAEMRAEFLRFLGSEPVVAFKVSVSPDNKYVHYLAKRNDGLYVSFATYKGALILPQLGANSHYRVLLPTSPVAAQVISRADKYQTVTVSFGEDNIVEKVDSLRVVGEEIDQLESTKNMMRLGLNPNLKYRYLTLGPVVTGDLSKGICAHVQDSEGNMYLFTFSGYPHSPYGSTELTDALLELCTSVKPYIKEELLTVEV
jgi:hypothetical protein